MSFIMLTLFVSAFATMNLVTSEHNTEFSVNGCETPTEWLNITMMNRKFMVDGAELKTVTVGKNACLGMMTENHDNEEHDFTVKDGDDEVIHMDTPANGSIIHYWQLPDDDLTLEFFCEVEGHADEGMKGEFIIGDGGGLPGFELPLVFVALAAMIAIPLKRRN